MIFYFSGTGNTLWAARQLAQATGEELFDMASGIASGYELHEGERIGFCFPVHGWQPPRIVRRFIGQLHVECQSRPYCYALCTCGDSIGKTMDIFRKILCEKNMSLDSFYTVVMPESYVALPFMYTDSQEREQKKLQEATTQMRRICEKVMERHRGDNCVVPGPLPWVLSHIVGAVFNRWMITDGPFKVDVGRCIKCGRCAEVCPVDDIIGGRGYVPQWKRSGVCTSCLSCYHHCPQHAILYGPLTHRRGQYYYGKNN